MATSVVSQYPNKSQVLSENFDHQNLVTSAADNGKKESIIGAPKDTSLALPGWYADVSWPGTISFQVSITTKDGSIT